MIQKGSSDVGNILISALSSFLPRSIGIWNSDRTFNHLFLVAFIVSVDVVCLGRNFLSRWWLCEVQTDVSVFKKKKEKIKKNFNAWHLCTSLQIFASRIAGVCYIEADSEQGSVSLSFKSVCECCSPRVLATFGDCACGAAQAALIRYLISSLDSFLS